jgi:hypothetical protein
MLDGVQFKACTPTGTGEVPVSPLQSGCYPNPFSSVTSFWFNLPENTRVQLNVYDIRGSLCNQLIDCEMPAGRHETALAIEQLQPGLYFYRLVAGSRLSTGKLFKIRQ